MARRRAADQQQPADRPNKNDEDIVAGALADDELMWQVQESLEAKRSGAPTAPFREILEEAKTHRSA